MRVFRNISWIFGANLFVAFTKWFLIVIIANLLTVEDVGIYSLAFAISAPVTLFANMKLRSLFVTEHRYNFHEYLKVRKILSLLTILILVIISVTIYPEYQYIIIIISLMKILDLQSDIYYSLPHKNEDMDYIGKHLIAKHLITLIAFICCVYLTKNLSFSLFIQLILQTIYVFFVEKNFISKKYLITSNEIRTESVKNILLLGLPLGFVQMLFSFNASYPRYLLEYFESAEVLGYFSAISYILSIGNLMMNAVSQNFLPILNRKVQNKDYKSFKKILYVNLTGLSAILGVLLVLVSVFLGDIFLEFFYGPEYAEYADIFVLVSLSMAVNLINWNFDTALLSLRFIKIQPVISLITTVFNIIIGWILIKYYGIYGAAYTMIVINTFQLLIRVYFVNHKIKSLTR